MAAQLDGKSEVRGLRHKIHQQIHVQAAAEDKG